MTLCVLDVRVQVFVGGVEAVAKFFAFAKAAAHVQRHAAALAVAVAGRDRSDGFVLACRRTFDHVIGQATR